MPKINVNVVTKFLQEIFEGRKITLYRISTKADKPVPKCTHFTDYVQAAAWVLQHNKTNHNIYYPYNIPKKNVTKKPTKDNIMWLSGLHVDVDMPSNILDDEREEWIAEHIGKLNAVAGIDALPQIIVTGNGVQGLYEFEEVIKATPKNIERVEYANRKIAHATGGDSCHNVDRILRVPGTKNWPNKKKKAIGYKPRQSDFVQVSDGFFTLENFADLPEPPAVVKTGTSEKRQDYTLLDYPEHYNPLSYDDLVHANPELDLFELEGDNSTDAMKFITHCITAFVAITKTDAHSLPNEVRKNIAHIVTDCEEDFMVHYDLNGPGKLGFDINRAMTWAADELFYTPKARRKSVARDIVKKVEETEEPETLSVNERVMFILETFRGRCRLEDLINLDTTSSGALKPTAPVTLPNVQEALRLMAVVPRWDDMRDMITFRFDDEDVQIHMDALTARANPTQKSSLELQYVSSFLIEVGLRADSVIRSHIETIALNNRFHPWTEYISEVVWDGVDRFSEVAACLVSKHPMKTTFIKTMFLGLAAVSTSHASYMFNETGQQLSSTLILVGQQGIGKSRFFEHIVPPAFMSNGSSLKVGTSKENDAMRECLGGTLCVLNELGQTFRRSEAESLKDFLSKKVDEYRLPYSRDPVVKPRCTVFVGTANELELKDQTGNRRFLPMLIEAVDFEALRAIDMQQVHAQAHQLVCLEKSEWWLSKEDAEMRDSLNDHWRERSEEELVLADYMSEVSGKFEEQWLSITQIFKVLNLKYSSHKAKAMSHSLKQSKIRYGVNVNIVNRKTGKSKRLRNVWKLPVTDMIMSNLI